ncbi:sugar ABC transporter permease [Glycomyces scopariae]|uniref:Raffinose/stachyose/melibiose transport system permease protein n=2 Tax=Glycomyces sambucus TaxID=380244 RepID=A0A1G9ND32_9ACTN|nr:raffinose/stachyose/melibiose transport system permease protein [Glycomyces sambucus]SDL84671.1 raffinose/stachyose/melibiose transport system permease protein [Glycomyces sambucus]
MSTVTSHRLTRRAAGPGRRPARAAAGTPVPRGMRGPVALSLLPGLVLFGTFFLVPFAVLAVTAFAEWGGLDFTWTGAENYRRMFTDPVFFKAFGNTLFYAAASVLVQVPLGIAVGMVLALRPRGWKALRTIIFVPFVISGAAYALIFSMFYNPRSGLLNNVLGALGMPGARDWLFETATARWAVAGTFVFIIGFVVVLVMAEIASIPRELYEAASVDGATTWQQLTRITLPLLRNVIGTAILIRLLVDIGMFDLVFILTAGGPDDATATLALYAYRAYVAGQWGYANAIGSIIILIGLVLILTVRRAFRIGERTL